MASVGEVLAEARREQGKSIKDVEKATKIRSKYIEALENNKFDLIPGDVYVKGFIRSYTQYLGLECEPLLKQYDAEYSHPLHYETHPPQYETSIPSPVRLTAPAGKTSSKSFIFSLIIGGILVVFIGLIIWGASLGGEKTKSHQPKPKKETPATKVTTTVPKPRVTTTTPTAALGEEVKPGRLTIKIKIVGARCWLRVLADGQKVYEGTLVQGDTKEWTAKKEIFIRTGNAPATIVWKNGKKLGPLEPSGGVAEKTFTLD